MEPRPKMQTHTGVQSSLAGSVT